MLIIVWPYEAESARFRTVSRFFKNEFDFIHTNLRLTRRHFFITTECYVAIQISITSLEDPGIDTHYASINQSDYLFYFVKPLSWPFLIFVRAYGENLKRTRIISEVIDIRYDQIENNLSGQPINWPKKILMVKLLLLLTQDKSLIEMTYNGTVCPVHLVIKQWTVYSKTWTSVLNMNILLVNFIYNLSDNKNPVPVIPVRTSACAKKQIQNTVIWTRMNSRRDLDIRINIQNLLTWVHPVL